MRGIRRRIETANTRMPARGASGNGTTGRMGYGARNRSDGSADNGPDLVKVKVGPAVFCAGGCCMWVPGINYRIPGRVRVRACQFNAESQLKLGHGLPRRTSSVCMLGLRAHLYTLQIFGKATAR